jgi:hypothetical protein
MVPYKSNIFSFGYLVFFLCVKKKNGMCRKCGTIYLEFRIINNTTKSLKTSVICNNHIRSSLLRQGMGILFK